ncbi:hypothetical protein [Streptomyces sp. NPDC048644]|uniref:hypothetical protein n=1 Tax=Streptomyces sp. NPDC048644 TaxID=3365582 RepID=UPI00371DCC8B
MFACLLIRRPRRLRHLRRLAAATAPATLTRLPAHPTTARRDTPSPFPRPGGASPGREELATRAWLHDRLLGPAGTVEACGD